MDHTLKIYNELQVLRAKHQEISAKLRNMRIQAADLPENSKERALLRAQYKIESLGLSVIGGRIATLAEEVSCEI